MGIEQIIIAAVVYFGVRLYDSWAAKKGLPQIPPPASPIPGADDLVTKLLNALMNRLPGLQHVGLLPGLLQEVQLLKQSNSAGMPPAQGPPHGFGNLGLAGGGQGGLPLSHILNTHIPISLELKPTLGTADSPRALETAAAAPAVPKAA